jgi:hypothetical protein
MSSPSRSFDLAWAVCLTAVTFRQWVEAAAVLPDHRLALFVWGQERHQVRGDGLVRPHGGWWYSQRRSREIRDYLCIEDGAGAAAGYFEPRVERGALVHAQAVRKLHRRRANFFSILASQSDKLIPYRQRRAISPAHLENTVQDIHVTVRGIRARFEAGERLEKHELDLLTADNFQRERSDELRLVQARFREAQAKGESTAVLLHQIDLRQRQIDAYWDKVGDRFDDGEYRASKAALE